MTTTPSQVFGKVYKAEVEISLKLDLFSLAIANYRLAGENSSLYKEIQTLASSLVINALGEYQCHYPEPHKVEFALNEIEVEVGNPVYVDLYETTRYNVGVQLGEEIDISYSVSGKDQIAQYVEAYIDDSYRAVKTKILVPVWDAGRKSLTTEELEAKARELYMAQIKPELEEFGKDGIIFI